MKCGMPCSSSRTSHSAELQTSKAPSHGPADDWPSVVQAMHGRAVAAICSQPDNWPLVRAAKTAMITFIAMPARLRCAISAARCFDTGPARGVASRSPLRDASIPAP